VRGALLRLDADGKQLWFTTVSSRNEPTLMPYITALSDGDIIEAHHLALPSKTAQSAGGSAAAPTDLSRPLADIERDYILAVLDDTGGNQSQAAKRLGISRNTLARKLKGYEEAGGR